MSEDIRHQLDVPSVQTAGAPFGQNIVIRGGAKTGDSWANIEGAVQCNVETGERDYRGQQTEVKTQAKLSF